MPLSVRQFLAWKVLPPMSYTPTFSKVFLNAILKSSLILFASTPPVLVSFRIVLIFLFLVSSAFFFEGVSVQIRIRRVKRLAAARDR